jgi:translation initiation factor IF-3
MNEDIKDKEVRLIDDEGEQLGVVSLSEALRLAGEKKLDLVKIAAQATPPVCKIMDYGKHKYEQQKRDKDARKKQKTAELKEVRLSLNIERHDLETKSAMAKKFLEKGDKVKVSLRFRGRELGHSQMGLKVFEEFAKEVEEFGKMEKTPTLEGRSMITIFQPLK